MMRGYAEARSCRRQYLLANFGEQLDEPCGACDVCWRASLEPGERDVHGVSGAVPEVLAGTGSAGSRSLSRGSRLAERGGAVRARWSPGLRVNHDGLGVGMVMDVAADRLTVLVDEHGYRTLSLEVVDGFDLLAAVDAGPNG